MRIHQAFEKWVGPALALLLLAPCSTAFASGFQLQEQTASGLGLAYSGMAAATQDASTVFWNPAGMSFMTGSELTVSAAYILPKFDFSNAGPPPTGSTYAAFGDGGNGGVSALVPALYLRMPVAASVSAGLAVNAPFGLSTEWSGQWAGMFHAVRSKVETLNINPGISWKAADFLSLGIGVSYQRLQATLTNALTPLIPTAQGRVDGSDWAWGWNAGALADLGEGTRIGLTYRSSASYRIAGALTFNNAAFAPLASSVAADMKLPAVASLAIAQRFESGVRILGDFTWTGWDSVRALTVVATSGPESGLPVSNDVLEFNNSWRAGIGVEYPLVPSWLLRVGTAYDRSPVQDVYRTPRLPDSDRTWLAFGARFQPNERWAFDAGYAHLWMKDGPSELAPSGPVPGTLIGTYSGDINIVAVQASMHF